MKKGGDQNPRLFYYPSIMIIRIAVAWKILVTDFNINT
jgi:hypothetical protein